MFELLEENGLSDFYRLADRPGVRVGQAASADRFAFLDEASVRDRLLDFDNGRSARVTLSLPGIHCVACVWLLENLFKLHAGVGRSVVNFGKREVTVTFDPAQIRLSELATLLSSIGYEPSLQLDSLERPVPGSGLRALYLKLGVAGFAFGNIMLFSVCLYAGLDRFNAPVFEPLFGWASLALAVPVVLYSASGYWQAAWVGLRQRALTLDLPIALGILALFGQSLYEVAVVGGTGYLDSLAGLVFFLLLGRVFQQRTYARLSFDRDYKSFFPLAVRRLGADAEHTVPLSELAVGDRVRLRHGELIPADARVLKGDACIDYSFVTGESEPVSCSTGERVYAGGRQQGGCVELEILKPVSQSYLTSLWSHEAFSKERDHRLDTLLNRFSRGFTLVVIAIAVAAAAWWWAQDPSRAIRAFTSVLIVACPCALALSAPFALGTAQRVLGRFNVFVRNTRVLETLSGVDAVVFDKTGTLTRGGGGGVDFQGEPLSAREMRQIRSLAGQSAHPQSSRIAAALAGVDLFDVESFQEISGQGIAGRVGGQDIRLGSATWVADRPSVAPPSPDSHSDLEPVSEVHLSVGEHYRGRFLLRGAFRPGLNRMLSTLTGSHRLVLLSGDKDRERPGLQSLLGEQAQLRFEQSPADKLAAIGKLQAEGRTVLMVGDGLNDAGALRQSDVGIAVVERVGTFSPASDIILEGRDVPALDVLLRFARGSVSVVWACIVLSLLYNMVGLAFAATGQLSPIVCAILMPLSSITVVTLACGAVAWRARRARLSEHLNPETTS